MRASTLVSTLVADIGPKVVAAAARSASMSAGACGSSTSWDDSRPAGPATASCGRVVDETQTVDKLLSMIETVADPDDTAFGVLTMKDAT